MIKKSYCSCPFVLITIFILLLVIFFFIFMFIDFNVSPAVNFTILVINFLCLIFFTVLWCDEHTSITYQNHIDIRTDSYNTL